MKQRIGAASALALIVSLVVTSAQAPAAIKRTVLQQHDISVPGREVVTAKGEIPGNGGTTGRHFHPGEEVGYVVEGMLTLEVEGQPDRTIKAGEAFIIPPGTVHNATNKASTQATVIANYIVEKGKPLTTPAK